MEFGSEFTVMTPKHRLQKKEKKDKLHFGKTKNVCASKYTIQTVKRQSKAWEILFGKSDNVFVSKICFKMQLSNEKTTQLKRGKEYE